jgi:undecaprenyl-diphosphatase
MRTSSRFFLLAALWVLPLIAVGDSSSSVAGGVDPGAPGTKSVQALPTPNRMSPLQAVILGIVEGLTEYLPVSSTGHLLLTQRLMNMDQTGKAGEAAEAYAICIQAGAILAVAGLYFGYVRRMAMGLIGRDAGGLRMGINLGIAFIPAALAGLLLEKQIKERLFGGGELGLWPVVGAWIVGGLLILVMDRWLRERRQSGRGLTIEQLTWRLALGIGVAQCVAMWPGVSRSLTTILGGLAVGLSLSAAVEFSFLLGLITLSASTAVDTLKHGPAMLEIYGWGTLLVGLVAAFISAAVAVTWLVRYLQRHPMTIFGWYRIVLGLAVSAWLWWRLT